MVLDDFTFHPDVLPLLRLRAVRMLKIDPSLTLEGLSDKISQAVALGWHDDARMKADYELVRDYVGIDKPFDVKTVYTNEFLDKSIKMKAVKPR